MISAAPAFFTHRSALNERVTFSNTPALFATLYADCNILLIIYIPTRKATDTIAPLNVSSVFCTPLTILAVMLLKTAGIIPPTIPVSKVIRALIGDVVHIFFSTSIIAFIDFITSPYTYHFACSLNSFA